MEYKVTSEYVTIHYKFKNEYSDTVHLWSCKDNVMFEVRSDKGGEQIYTNTFCPDLWSSYTAVPPGSTLEDSAVVKVLHYSKEDETYDIDSRFKSNRFDATYFIQLVGWFEPRMKQDNMVDPEKLRSNNFIMTNKLQI